MRFVYSYNTRDNERRSGEISAASRDAAFAALKAQGVKPIRVELAPGFFNRIRSFGKRGLAIVLLAVALVVTGLVLQLRFVALSDAALSPLDRRQIYADAAQLAECSRMGWRNVFTDEFECLLAHYAQPGAAVSVDPSLVESATKAAQTSLSRDVQMVEGESELNREVKRIIQGMKMEAREFVAAGGTVGRYVQCLSERQRQEAEYRENVSQLFDVVRKVKTGGELYRVWCEKNDELRAMGLCPLPMPNELSGAKGAGQIF